MAFTVEEFRDLLTLPQLVRELVEAQRGTEERLAGVETRLERLERALQTLVEVQLRVETDLGKLKGSDLERRYERHAGAYFSPLIRRARVLTSEEQGILIDDALQRGQLTEQEADDLMQADIVARGRAGEDRREVYIVVEVSWGVGTDDVRRAIERAAALAKTGVEAIPVVAGDWVTSDAQTHARAAGVWQVTDGPAVSPAAA